MTNFDFMRDELQLKTFTVKNPVLQSGKSISEARSNHKQLSTREQNLEKLQSIINSWLTKNDITELNIPSLKIQPTIQSGYSGYLTYYKITKVKPQKKSKEEIIYEACKLFDEDKFDKVSHMMIIIEYAKSKYNTKITEKLITDTVEYNDD